MAAGGIVLAADDRLEPFNSNLLYFALVHLTDPDSIITKMNGMPTLNDLLTAESRTKPHYSLPSLLSNASSSRPFSPVESSVSQHEVSDIFSTADMSCMDIQDILGSQTDDARALFGADPFVLSTSLSLAIPTFNALGGLAASDSIPSKAAVLESSTASINSQTGAPASTVFGFGSFESTFMTDEELVAAQEKLSADEVKSKEQALDELCSRLLKFQLHPQPDSMSKLHESINSDNLASFYSDITICYGFVWLSMIEFGKGTLCISNQKMHWTGTFPGVSTDTIYLVFLLKDLAKMSRYIINISQSFVTINAVLFQQKMHGTDYLATLFLKDSLKCQEMATCIRAAIAVLQKNMAKDATRCNITYAAETEDVDTDLTLESQASLDKLDHEYRLKLNDAQARRDAAVLMAESQYTAECTQLQLNFQEKRLAIAILKPSQSASTTNDMGTSLITQQTYVGICQLCCDDMITKGSYVAIHICSDDLN
ncbi:hypothetical protein BATDEDRAFT_23449 [Batrachochytrium dendrobatidis JAM81]|uniref:Uncharacterized protein n=1 Tax=Batrachochytrium dendrobatidis (strain JAM81 / FGSC 10211) TaxID=684364 RepID=F4NZ24_BATDJ|nr:uncharacterized protein BATDEDRAFT_23449 [Batrachochytrium dendrobatidis JAM81]EGF81810.1 hypothetical protein BATDEDRAFT_23449 [Batrachochytrium dendrobatidis JAM81]|eukprot:XP_006677283.1 hypothetical protein BATDEDRAFT_23449 [Batrachochytrium dendrobatidis JAM81]